MTVHNIAEHPRFRPQRQLITRKQLMALWSIKSINTIKAYEKRGMPVVTLPSGQPRYDEAECQAWLELISQ